MLSAGETLEIPCNTIHSMWNGSGEKSVVNWKVQPALDTEYFLETGMGLAAQGKVNKKGMPSIWQAALLAERYQNVFRLAKPWFVWQQAAFKLLASIGRLMGYKAVYRELLN